MLFSPSNVRHASRRAYTNDFVARSPVEISTHRDETRYGKLGSRTEKDKGGEEEKKREEREGGGREKEEFDRKTVPGVRTLPLLGGH